jgi:DUF1680 family protein
LNDLQASASCGLTFAFQSHSMSWSDGGAHHPDWDEVAMRNMLSRRDVSKALLIGSLSMAGRSAAAAPATDALASFDYSGVRLLPGGMLHTQAQNALQLFKGISDDSFLYGFRARAARAGQPAPPGESLGGWYGADFYHAFGQYISGMARLSRALNDDEIGNKARHLVSEWDKTIDGDGYFFYSRPGPTILWKTLHYNYDKTMCGLVDVYKYAGFTPAADMMSQITDWAVKNLDRSRAQPDWPGLNAGEWYTLSENLYRAFEATGDKKFRCFGDVWQYTEYWNMFVSGKPPTPPPHAWHAYSHVNTLSGCAMAYRLTRDPRYLQAIVNAYQWLEQTQMFATGGYGPFETLVAPDGALGKSLDVDASLFPECTFETACGSWAGIKLGRYLLEFTGEPHYGDWIERLVYNGIGSALSLQSDGSTFYYSDYRVSGARKVYFPGYLLFPKLWPCCSGTYIQAIADYQNLIYFHEPHALLVNLYVPSTVTWDHGGNAVQLRQETTYPESDTSLITVSTGRPDAFAIKFRVPRWCDGAAAEVNGSAVAISREPGTWAVISRLWNEGDQLKVTLPMAPIAMPVDQQHPRRVAYSYGPVVLVGRGNGQTLRDNGRLPQSFVRKSPALEFDLENITFVPFYSLSLSEPYQIYFDLQG